MFASILPSTVAGQAVLFAGVCVAALTFAGALHRRLRVTNARLLSAINNMSQGLNMFDAQGRIILLNRRYLEMYKLSPEVVKVGCALQQLIQHRKETGLFSGDVESYCRKILDERGQESLALCAGERRAHRPCEE